MVWVRHRFAGSERPVPALSPFSTCASVTIIKTGVMLCKHNGDIAFIFPNANVAEVIDDKHKYVQVQKETKNGFKFPDWEIREPVRDSTGKIIG